MNKIYRTVYSRAAQTWVAVPEIAKTHGKSAGGKSATFTLPAPRFTVTALASALLLASGQAMAVTGTGSTTGNSNYCFYDETSQTVVCGDDTTSSVDTVNGSPAKSVVLGIGATNTGERGVAIGFKSQSAQTAATALGAEAKATGLQSFAGGYQAAASGEAAIAIGSQAKASKRDATAIGKGANASGQDGVAVGLNANAAGQGVVAIGTRAGLPRPVGNLPPGSAVVAPTDAVFIGSSAGYHSNNNRMQIAIGNNAGKDVGNKGGASTENIAIGNSAGMAANGNTNVAISSRAGQNVTGHDNFAALVEAGQNVKGTHNIAIGKRAGRSADAANPLEVRSTIALGSLSEVGANNAIAIGGSEGINDAAPTAVTKALGKSSIAIGKGSHALAENTIAIGVGNIVRGANSGAFGDPSIIDGTDSYSVGNNNTIVTGTNNIFAFGNGITADVSNSVYLGSSARATSAAGKTRYADGSVPTAPNAASTAGTGSVTQATVGGITYSGFAGTAPAGLITLGASGLERRIQNVAAGEISATSTDAINGSQLFAVASQIASGAGTHYYSVKRSNPQGGNYNNDGASAENALAAGVNAAASGVNATAVGLDAKAQSGNTIAVGNNATASDVEAIAIGRDTQASKTGAIAMGQNSRSTGTSSTAVGLGTQATGNQSAAFGATAAATADQAMAIGYQTAASARYSTALGNSANASGTHASALGSGATAVGGSSIAVGSGTATGGSSVAIGRISKSYTGNDIAIGSEAEAGINGGTASSNAIAMGRAAKATYLSTIAIGNGAVVTPTGLNGHLGNLPSDSIGAIAMGENTNVGGEGAVAIGRNSKSTFANSTTVGHAAAAVGYNSSAFGFQSKAAGHSSVAIGDKALAGTDSGSRAGFTVAIGTNTNATGENAVAMGSNAESKAHRGTAVGVLSQVTQREGAAFGSFSVANRAGGVAGSDVLGAKDPASHASAWTATHAAFSVGNDAAHSTTRQGNGGAQNYNMPLVTRQIIGVAAGSNDTDAVNVAQLKAAGFNLTTSQSSGTATGTSVEKIKNGNTFTLDAGNGIALHQAGSKITISTNAQALAESAQLPVVYTDGFGNKVYKHTDGNFYDQPNGAGTQIDPADIVATMQAANGSVTTPTALTNVAAGANDTDAVNVSQLKGAADALGGGAGINPDGSFKAPSYVINKTDGTQYAPANNVGDALKNLNDEVVKPITFGGDNIAQNFDRTLGSEVFVKGGADPTKLTNNNIGVVSDGNGTLTVKLAENIDLGASGSLKTGNTTVNNAGVTIANPADPTKNVSLTGSGLNNGGNQITNVASGGNVDSNAANIGDVKRLAAAAAAAADTSASVSAGSAAVTVTPGTPNNGITDYAVDLSAATKASLAKADTAVQNVVGDGNVRANKVGDTVSLSLAPVLNIGPSTGGNPVTINGNAGTIGGLTNKTFNPNSFVSGQAATEDQLAQVANQVAASQTHYYSANDGGVQQGNYNNNGATGGNAVAAGVGTQASGISSTAIGHNANAVGNASVAAGWNSQATGSHSMALGGSSGSSNTTAAGDSSMAIGFGAQTEGGANWSMAQGDLAKVEQNAERAMAIGAQATVKADADRATALGSGATVDKADGVALGSNSVADRAATTAGAATSANPTVGTEVYADPNATQADKDAISATVKGNLGAVSVGDANNTRQITNVAAGSADTDAVNVAQLKAVVNNTNVNLSNQINRLEGRIGEVDRDASAGVAQAIATAGLPQAYLPGKNMVAVSGGFYRGQAGYAVGFSTISDNGNWIIKATGSGNSRGNFGGSIGAGYQW